MAEKQHIHDPIYSMTDSHLVTKKYVDDLFTQIIILYADDLGVLTSSQGRLNANPFYMDPDDNKKNLKLSIQGRIAILHGWLAISPTFYMDTDYVYTGTLSVPNLYLPKFDDQKFLFLNCVINEEADPSTNLLPAVMYLPCPRTDTGTTLFGYKQNPNIKAGEYSQIYINASWIF